MAVFNEILVGRFNRALQKFTGIKGGPPAPTHSTEIMPVIPFPIGREFRYLESWALWGGPFVIGAPTGVLVASTSCACSASPV